MSVLGVGVFNPWEWVCLFGVGGFFQGWVFTPQEWILTTPMLGTHPFPPWMRYSSPQTHGTWDTTGRGTLLDPPLDMVPIGLQAIKNWTEMSADVILQAKRTDKDTEIFRGFVQSTNNLNGNK